MAREGLKLQKNAISATGTPQKDMNLVKNKFEQTAEV